MYGIKNYQSFDENKIQKIAKKYKIPEGDLYFLSNDYNKHLKTFDSINKEAAKNRYQPLQACYYNQSGYLESFQINCYAGGFPNLKWNRDGIFNTFIPKQQAPLDSLFDLKQHQNFIQAYPFTNPHIEREYDYTIVVHWSIYFGRQSKRLIRFVQKNAALANPYTLRIIYVNVDACMTYKE